MSGAVPGRLLVLVVAAPVAAAALEEEVRAVRAVVVFFSAAAVEEEEGVAGLAVALVLVRDAEGVETEDLAAAAEELLVLGLAESAGRRRRCQESSFNAVLSQTLRNKNGRNMQLHQIKFDLCCTVHVNVAFSIYAALTEHSEPHHFPKAGAQAAADSACTPLASAERRLLPLQSAEAR